MSSISRKHIEDLANQLAERMRAFREDVADQIAGPPFGFTEPGDDAFRVWYEEKTAQDPLWPFALEFAIGGPAIRKRYERITGLMDDDG